MPVMDGYEATRRLRQRPRFADLPIIAMSAHVMADDVERCLACGMQAHIAKPIDWRLFFQLLQGFVKPRQISGAEVSENEPSDRRLEFPRLRGVDFDLVRQACNHNVPLYRKMLEVFQRQYGDAIANIRSLWLGGDSHQAALRTHQLNGSACALGATVLSSTLKALEQALQDDNANDVPDCLAQAEAELSALLLEIERVLWHGE